MDSHGSADHRTRQYLADPELNPPRILLAEDDSEMRALVSGVLRSVGYSVVECGDGTALLQRLDEATRGGGLGVDLVVSDIVMPGLTGLEVLEKLRSADPFTPYVVVTAFGSPTIREAATRLGAMDVLDKPYEMKNLLRLVEDAVGVGSARSR